MRSQLAIGNGAGPVVARAVQTLVGLVFLDAWLSLGAQVHLLIESRGLLPAARTFAAWPADPVTTFLAAPTVFWLGASDLAIGGGVAVGVVLALLIVAGVLPRPLLVASALLYLSYAVACDPFTSFQWDNMLVEAGVLVALLPRERPAPLPHLLLRLLLVKLYVLSGIAKWQSHLGDWLDGSAMTFYYETAPLPTPLAWWAHHLPDGWHHVESWAALALELVVPWLALGPRRARLGALVLLTGFQIVNLATANYGFFVWLTLALHVALLDDQDLGRARTWLRRRVGWERAGTAAAPGAGAVATTPPASATRAHRIEAVLVGAYAVFWLTTSLAIFLVRFVPEPPFAAAARAVVTVTGPWRLANPYHLFGHITRERLEPQFETRTAATADWTEQDLRFKPGDPRRAPPFVAPHQPRVDFQLWFYGLGFRGPLPPYVAAILTKLCRDPGAVQPLFAAPLPPAPEAVRLAIWRYTFTSPDEARATGAWWNRELVGTSRALACDQVATDQSP